MPKKILYGICNVGKGHLIRSKVLIDYLLKKGHEVLILTGSPNYEYLKGIYKNVYDIGGLEIIFKDNKISSWATLTKNLKKISKKNYEFLLQTEKIIEEINPEIVITDWEPYVTLYAKKHNKKLIAVENQHYLVYGDYDYPKKYYLAYLKAKTLVKSYLRAANKYILLTLPDMKLKTENKNVQKINPIIRPEIEKIKTSDTNKILVYYSTGSYRKIIEILQRFNFQFVIYGFNEEKQEKNITLKKFNEVDFVEDLASSKAVITSAGQTLITECIYLKKPILAIPIAGHFEQILNALFIQEQNYGKYTEEFTEEALIDFLSKLNIYKRKSFKPGNKDLFRLIEKELK